MTFEWLIIAAVVIYAITAFARHMNRSEADKQKPSWLVKGLNAAGAKVEATRTLPAVRELIERGLRTVARRTGRAAVSGAQAVKAKAAEKVASSNEAALSAARRVTEMADRRWRERADRAPLLWRPSPSAAGGEQPATPVSPVGASTAGDSAQPDGARPGGAPQSDPDQLGETSQPDGAPQSGDTPQADGSRPDDAQPTTDQTDRPHLHIVQNKEDTNMTVTNITPVTATPAAESNSNTGSNVNAPSDWANIVSRVGDFAPETDADLINFMTCEVLGVCLYGEAYERLYERCVNELGLDPKAVEGLREFAQQLTELTQAMSTAHQKFVTTYQEVMEAVSNGVVLPYNGRFFGQAV